MRIVGRGVGLAPTKILSAQGFLENITKYVGGVADACHTVNHDWVDALTVPLFSEPTVPYDVILCIVGDQRPIFCREPQQKRRRLA